MTGGAYFRPNARNTVWSIALPSRSAARTRSDTDSAPFAGLNRALPLFTFTSFQDVPSS